MPEQLVDHRRQLRAGVLRRLFAEHHQFHFARDDLVHLRRTRNRRVRVPILIISRNTFLALGGRFSFRYAPDWATDFLLGMICELIAALLWYSVPVIHLTSSQASFLCAERASIP